VQETESSRQQYLTTLKQAGADVVFSNVQELTPSAIAQLVFHRE